MGLLLAVKTNYQRFILVLLLVCAGFEKGFSTVTLSGLLIMFQYLFKANIIINYFILSRFFLSPVPTSVVFYYQRAAAMVVCNFQL
jgi:hypothetical protein